MNWRSLVLAILLMLTYIVFASNDFVLKVPAVGLVISITGEDVNIGELCFWILFFLIVCIVLINLVERAKQNADAED